MNRLGLTLISEIMQWPDDGTATREYQWLRLMSATKYERGDEEEQPYD